MHATSQDKIKPEVLAAISAALAVYNCPPGQACRITKVTKRISAWKKAGIMEIMVGREIRTTTGR